MTEFGKERMRSIAGFVCGLLTIQYMAHFGAVRGEVSSFEQWFLANSATDWMWAALWGGTALFYASGAIPVWVQQMKTGGRLSTLENWAAAFHPWSGMIAVAFVLWHLGCFQWPSASLEGNAFAWVAAYVGSSNLIVFVYCAGIAALSLHIAWGLWRFAVSWGLATGEKSMGRMTIVSSILFCWMVLTGLESLAVFLGSA